MRFPRFGGGMITLALLITVIGCQTMNTVGQMAGLGSMVPWTPPEHVAGPDSAYIFTTPALLTPGARVSTKGSKPGKWSASFSDDLCRAYHVEIDSVAPDLVLAENVRAGTNRIVERDKAIEVVQRTDTLEQLGEAIFVRYRVPKGSPCGEQQIGGGFRLVPKVIHPDAEIAHYFFQRGTLVFHVWYGRPLNEKSAGTSSTSEFGIRVGPAEQVLKDFLKGLTIRC